MKNLIYQYYDGKDLSGTRASVKSMKDYANQSEIDLNRRKQFLVALFHYELDVPTLIRFLGGNYTGECKDINSTIKILLKSKCNSSIISDL